MTSKERTQAGIRIAHLTGQQIHGNGCNYPITFETPADNDEDCTDLEMVFDRGTGFPTIFLPLLDSLVCDILSQIKGHEDYMIRKAGSQS